MTGYELSKNWFDWCFENPEKITPNHSAMYFFAIEHCNRLGWKNKFGFPMEMTKEAIGISNYRTYSKTFEDLVSWGFIKIFERSKNQYSATIIGIVQNAKANTKALSKATQKHDKKQVHGIVGIDKPNNLITLEPINSFKENLLAQEIWMDSVCIKNKLKSHSEIPFLLCEFENHLISTKENHKTEKDYTKHFSNWLRIKKEKVAQKNGKQSNTDKAISF